MPRTEMTAADRLVTLSNPRSPISEAYRQLRTNIQFSSLDRPIRTLLVTSTSPREGKSTTLANLAVTIAQSGKSVLVVDCDLRKPSLHDIFGLSNRAGLTTMLIDADDPDAHVQDPGIEGLRVITSGPLPPNPSELLGSHRMEELIQRLRQRADYVLFDTPPIIAVTDAAVVATRVDGAILVIRAGTTRRDLAQKAKALLDKVNANLIGVVLNGVKSDSSLHQYYGHDART